MIKFLIPFFLLACLGGNAQQKLISVDICVYGATSGGVIAAYTAAKLGKKVILVTPEGHSGGLSSGGLGNTDIGNKIAITGLARDFYRRVGIIMVNRNNGYLNPMWQKIFSKHYIREAAVPVLYHQSLKTVFKKGSAIQEIQTTSTDQSPVITAYHYSCQGIY